MKKFAAFLLILLLPHLLLAQNKTLVFDHVAVIDMVSPEIRTDMTVVIEGGRISAVKKSGKVKLSKDAQIIDARGKFLMPGLWDMHAHVLRASRIDFLQTARAWEFAFRRPDDKDGFPLQALCLMNRR